MRDAHALTDEQRKILDPLIPSQKDDLMGAGTLLECSTSPHV